LDNTLLRELQLWSLGLKQRCLGCLYRLMAINAGQNYLDFRIGFMQYSVHILLGKVTFECRFCKNLSCWIFFF